MKQQCEYVGGGYKYSNRVDLSGYTSSNKFTVPRTGFVIISTISSEAQTNCQIVVEDANSNWITGGTILPSGSVANLVIPVFAGMHVYRTQTISNALFYYYPTE